MHRVTSVKAKPNYVLSLAFDDGTQGEVCLSDRLFGPMFEPLRDPEFFDLVSVDQFGAVCWPNGADLAPDALHRRVIDQKSL
jgi:hypothetical protein